MQLMMQVFWILFFYLLGQGVSLLLGGIIPGSVLGMIFLFGALSLGYLKEESVDKVSNALLNNMVLFFLPATVGLVATWGLLMSNLIPILTATIVSTVLIIVVIALIQQTMERRSKRMKNS